MSGNPYDRLALLLSMDAPEDLLAELAADEIQRLRDALQGIVDARHAWAPQLQLMAEHALKERSMIIGV